MEKIRSVNLGGWFVLERWIKPSLFKNNNVVGNDETCFSEQAINKVEELFNHYKTWITKDDIVWLKEKGINLVRIPIPWWLYGDKDYVRSVKHLDFALEMISDVGMDFMLDLHAAPGCQNGFDNGGIEGQIEWHKDEKNIEMTILVLEKIAKRYKDYPHFHSLQFLNEPNAIIDIKIIQDFYKKTYKRIRKILPNKYLVMHDGFRLNEWENFFRENNFHNVILDTHMYQCFDKYHHNLTIEWHLEDAINRSKRLALVEEYVPVIVGEWSLGLRINEQITDANMDDVMKKYASAQLKGMKNVLGHTFWNYKVEYLRSGWNFKRLVEKEIISIEEFKE